MPYASESQRRKFHIMEKQGKISARTVAEWDKASKGKKLLKYVKGSKSEPHGMLKRGMQGKKR